MLYNFPRVDGSKYSARVLTKCEKATRIGKIYAQLHVSPQVLIALVGEALINEHATSRGIHKSVLCVNLNKLEVVVHRRIACGPSTT